MPATDHLKYHVQNDQRNRLSSADVDGFSAAVGPADGMKSFLDQRIGNQIEQIGFVIH